MEYYIKILPKYKVSTYSKYSYDRLSSKEKEGILSSEVITANRQGIPYKHGGYVKCLYGENEVRYIVYENIPQFGHVKGRFKTMQEAVSYIESVKELETL